MQEIWISSYIPSCPRYISSDIRSYWCLNQNQVLLILCLKILLGKKKNSSALPISTALIQFISLAWSPGLHDELSH